MTILDGKQTSAEIKLELKDKVDAMKSKGMRPPHLAAILVGENPASASYVRNKIRFCQDVGFRSTLVQLPSDISEEALLAEVDRLNKDDELDGYIVQLPLPKHIDEQKVNLAIDHRKDVDGFHPMNFGRMAQGLNSFLPATPMGILEMLKRYDIETSGKHVVVLGRSNIVGTPISILMSRKGPQGNSTVTLTHSRTRDLSSEVKRADIVVAAIGIPKFVTSDMIKDGAIIIDVGINRVDDDTRKSGYRLVGDVDFDDVSNKVSHITPVPGGVGPMTVAALMINTYKAAIGEIY